MLQKASGYDPLGSREKSSHFTHSEKHFKWSVLCRVTRVEIVDQSTGDLVYIDRNSTPINSKLITLHISKTSSLH